MRIAQISPLYESVPPKLYGGTERVVSYLTEELVNQGHEVTLFASGDSITKARLVSHVSKALRLNEFVEDPLSHHIIQIQDVAERAHEFDILHFHTDYLHFPFSSKINKAQVTTLHGRLDIPDLQHVYNKFQKQPIISISNSQRKPILKANWINTIYHGLPLDLYKKGEGTEDYVVFMGRISPEKRPDRAIEIARKAGLKIKIAAKIDKADQRYYHTLLKEQMEQPHVEYIGEIGEPEKGDILGQAKALLFPIDWPEPFGMVMIESMACGTPVIAFNNGSVPEIIDPGKTGYIVDNIEDAVNALENIHRIDRNEVREIFETRFSSKVMATNYLQCYELLMKKAGRKIFVPVSGAKFNTRRKKAKVWAEKKTGPEKVKQPVIK